MGHLKNLAIVAVVVGVEVACAHYAHARDLSLHGAPWRKVAMPEEAKADKPIIAYTPEDKSGVSVYLTDEISDSGKCEGLPIAVSGKAKDIEHHKGVWGCWAAYKDGTVKVVFMLKEGTIFLEVYKQSDFTLTDYGRWMKTGFQKGI